MMVVVVIIIATWLVKKFPAFYGTKMLITMLTRACHWSLYCSRWIQIISSHPISLRSILILSYYLHIGLQHGLFPSGFPVRILYAFLIYPICVTCPTHLWIDHPKNIWWNTNKKLLIMQSYLASCHLLS